VDFYIGYDIGAISVNRVVIDDDKNIIDVLPYTRHYGEPVRVVGKDIEALAKRKDISKISGIAFTGSGGKILASLLHADFINEIEAIITSIKYFYSDIKTVIEIGGQDSKFIDLVAGDYAMNELCSAGTGSFLDQQASRFNLTIEEFTELALKSKSPSTIAGRCSVFAKSDMIHLQQEAAKDEDIALGLCYAMARSFKSGIVKGKNFQPPIIFCGGVSFNKAMNKAFEDILKEPVIIPEHRESIGAMGAALSLALKNHNQQVNLEEVGRALSDYLKNFKYKKETFKPLILEKSKLPIAIPQKYDFKGKKIDAFIGVDVGSISTNVVAIDRDKKLIAKCYLRTAGRPIEAVRKGIEIIGNEIGNSINVKAVGTTGSGRYLIGDLVGADTIINEITAQATSAANIDKTVDTIFEIGGQDSKYISLEKGVVVDFEMNKICAAGTGSFLEEQAERFDIKIEDFGGRALKAASPLNLGERCTVFMETNVYSHYQNGANIEDILAGLAYSIAINYINRVVGRKKIGNKIFFQGAVAYNKAVVAAFENYLGKEIIVPENHEVTGAIGTAIAALENEREETNFRGFSSIANIKYAQSSFECRSCPNMCEIKKVTFENSKPLFYGGRCEKYEKLKSSENGLVDLFAQREELLFDAYKKPDKEPEASIKKIGIPFTMLTYEFYPFWDAFFSGLGFEVVLSDKTNKKIINDGLGLVVAETCFPMKVVIGHVQNLLDKQVDYIFIPSIRDMPCKDNKIEGARTGSYPCPFVQGMSTMVKASMNIDQEMLIDPLINFSFKEYLKENQLRKLGKRLGKKDKIIKRAIGYAQIAQQKFYTSVTQKGMEALSSLGPDETAAVIVSRPYNSCDSSISMDIPRKLREIGMQAIPLDYLPLENIDLFESWPNMYWEFGDRIMSAAEIIKKDKRLYPVYITNFGCGPDSFIMQYFEREMDRPFLKIEVDEHTAGAGVITRCEAFSDSLKNVKNLKEFHKFKSMGSTNKNDPSFKRKDNRTIYIPYMGDGAYAVRAAFKFTGTNAEVMQSDHETLEIGRRHTLGKECYPFIITTGDILKTLKYNDPKKAAFLMPMTHGPCRFGQYNKMQKIIIKEQGYDDVPIVAPGAPESSQFYKEYDMQGIKGTRLLSRAMAGIFAVDYLNKFLRYIRPFEVNKGETDNIYQAHLNKVCQIIENKENMKVLDKLTGVLELAKKDFARIKRKDELRPVIGIVGEIYVRNHPFSNNEIIRKIEELGGVVKIPDFGEWSDHTNATSKLDISIKQKDLAYKIRKSFGFNNDYDNSNNNGYENSSYFNDNNNFSTLKKHIPNYVRGLNFFAANRIFKHMTTNYHKILEKSLKDSMLDLEEADIYEIWDNAEPYIIKWFGEAALSVGKSIAWIKKGIDGIVNVLPFTCMPGTMVTAISKRLREEYGVPWLNLAFDGLEQETSETRLEAFMYQAKEYKLRKLNKEKNNK
jgi:predicted CoA-substrate-specific enzyme activase